MCCWEAVICICRLLDVNTGLVQTMRMRGALTGNVIGKQQRGRHGSHVMPPAPRARHASKGRWGTDVVQAVSDGVVVGVESMRTDGLLRGVATKGRTAARQSADAIRGRRVAIAVNACITVVFVVAGGPGFGPDGPPSVAGGVTTTAQSGLGGQGHAAVTAESADAGPGGPGHATVAAEPADGGPHGHPAQHLPYRNTTAEAPDGSGVISELSEFYSEYAAVELDRQHRISPQPIATAGAPSIQSYAAPESVSVRQLPAEPESDVVPDGDEKTVADSPAEEPVPPSDPQPDANVSDQQNENPVAPPKDSE